MVCTLDKNIEHIPLGSSACVRMYVRGLEWMAWTLFFGKRYAIPCTEIYVKYCEVCGNTAKDGERLRTTAKTRERRRKHGTDSEKITARRDFKKITARRVFFKNHGARVFF